MDQANAELIIYDYQGKVVAHSRFSDTNFSDLVEGLASGLYMVKVTSEEQEITGRLIRR